MRTETNPSLRYNPGSASETVECNLAAILPRLWAGVIFSVGTWAAPHLAFATDQQKPDIVLISGDKTPSADDWPQFRGPTGNGISLATNVPLSWSSNQNVKPALLPRARSSAGAGLSSTPILAASGSSQYARRFFCCQKCADGCPKSVVRRKYW